MIAFHQISWEGRSWVLNESLVYWILVVASLLWWLRVVARVALVPHVVVAFAAFLRRFAEDPPTTVAFLVPKQKLLFQAMQLRENRLIFFSGNGGHRMRRKRNNILVCKKIER